MSRDRDTFTEYRAATGEWSAGKLRTSDSVSQPLPHGRGSVKTIIHAFAITSDLLNARSPEQYERVAVFS